MSVYYRFYLHEKAMQAELSLTLCAPHQYSFVCKRGMELHSPVCMWLFKFNIQTLI